MNDLVKIPFGDIERASLNLPPGLDYHDWRRVGQKLLACNDSVQFWIGDWINYGEANYGDKYAEALAMFGTEERGQYGYEEHTLHNFASVAKRVESSRRREKLSWSHHEIVAALPPDKQSELLKEAEDKKMTKREFSLRCRGVLKNPATSGINSMAHVFMWESWLPMQHLKLQKQLESSPPSAWEDGVLASRLRWFEKMEKPLRDEASRRGLAV